MSGVVSNDQVPSGVASSSPTPRMVLFQRGVDVASVAASGDGAVGRKRPRDVHGVDVVGQRHEARVEFSEYDPGNPGGCQSRSVASCFGGVESLSVASASVSVALEFVSVASSVVFESPSAGRVSPRSVIPLALHRLRQRAAAAKVLRGRRRLQMAGGGLREAECVPVRVRALQPRSGVPVSVAGNGLVSVRSVRVPVGVSFQSASEFKSCPRPVVH